MIRIVLTSLVVGLLPLTAAAQVRIHLPSQHQEKYKKIIASVENSGNTPVTFCVEYGQWSPRGDGDVEASPYPFWVQQKYNGKWNTLINGPDVGSMRAPVVLDPRKSMDFPFRLAGSGKMGLRLNYWSGGLPSMDCHARPKHTKLITSPIFTVE